MLLEHSLEDITEPIIIFEAPNFWHDPNRLEGFIVQFIHEGEMRVGNHHIRQLLDVS